MVEFVELKNKLLDLKVERHKINDLIDILLFKLKVNEELDKHEQENLKALCEKSEKLNNEIKDIEFKLQEMIDSRN